MSFACISDNLSLNFSLMIYVEDLRNPNETMNLFIMIFNSSKLIIEVENKIQLIKLIPQHFMVPKKYHLHYIINTRVFHDLNRLIRVPID